MKLCHCEENILDFQNLKKRSTIEIITLSKGEQYNFFSDSTLIIFIQNGSLRISCNEMMSKNLNTGEIVLIPVYYSCLTQCNKKTTLLVIKFDFNAITFCDYLPLELLLMRYKKTKKDKTRLQFLMSNQKLTKFFKLLSDNIKSGVVCPYYFDLKIQEFIYLTRIYCDNNAVFSFFKPLYSGDFAFINNVNKGLNQAKTLKDLAKILNYSLSGFEKKFKRVFKVAPYQWMQEQRAEKIYNKIVCSKTTFSEIAFENGFSSPAHLNEFCRKRFGKTPGGIRKENKDNLMALK